MLTIGDEFLTIADVAGLLKVSTRAIRKWVQQDRFPEPTRFGKSVRWRRAVILDILDHGIPREPAAGSGPAAAATEPPPAKRKRGRPPGSKNTTRAKPKKAK